MVFERKLRKVGNSAVLVLPKEALACLNVAPVVRSRTGAPRVSPAAVPASPGHASFVPQSQQNALESGFPA